MSREVKIVVTTCNDLFYAQQCLESIRTHTRYPHTILVVDNHSTDGTLEYLHTLEGIQIIANMENMHSAYAARQGVEAIGNAEYLIFTDSDVVIYEDGWLTEMVEHIDSDGQIGAIGPKCGELLFGAELSEIIKAYVLDKKWLERLIGPNTMSEHELLDLLTLVPQHSQGPSFNELCGWAQMYKREVIEKIGLPETNAFPPNQLWDSEYSMRVLPLGYRLENSPVVLSSKAKMQHFGGRSKLFLTDPVRYAETIQADREYIRRRRCQNLIQLICHTLEARSNECSGR